MRILSPCFTGILQSLICRKQERAQVLGLLDCIFLLPKIYLWSEDSPSLFSPAPAADHSHTKGTIQFCGMRCRVKLRLWRAGNAKKSNGFIHSCRSPLLLLLRPSLICCWQGCNSCFPAGKGGWWLPAHLLLLIFSEQQPCQHRISKRTRRLWCLLL